MVTDPLFPTCPIRNVLARLCGLDTLWAIHVLSETEVSTLEELHQKMKGLTRDEVSTAIRTLAEDHIVEFHHHAIQLSAIGQSFVPYMKGLESWCEQQM